MCELTVSYHCVLAHPHSSSKFPSVVGEPHVAQYHRVTSASWRLPAVIRYCSVATAFDADRANQTGTPPVRQ